MNVAKKFQQAEDLFFKGKYQEAADACKHIIDQKPDFPKAYYLLAALFKTTGQFASAISFCDMAIERDPKDASFYVQKGHTLLNMGRPEEAELVLMKALELDPRQPLPLMLLANIKMKRRDFDGALSHLNQAKTLSDITEINEHIGLCYQMQGKFSEAEAVFRELLKKSPDLPRIHLHLAKILFDAKRRDEAEPLFLKALALDPNIYEALIALARIEDVRGNPLKSIEYAERAVRVNPSQLMGYILLGGALISVGNHVNARVVYEAGLKLFPDDIFLVEGYAKVLMQIGLLDQAKHYISKVLEKKPDDKNMRYFYAVICGETPESAPREYVAGLFDEYADRFEEHLQKGLRYNTPNEISLALRSVLNEQARVGAALSLLDLGCGTGLGTQVLLDITSFRVGVDLSAKMVEKSIEKGFYAETAVQDIVEYMEHTAHRFDIIICVDTLVYIGNLDPFMRASRATLNPRGLLAVSVEQDDSVDSYKIRESARFGHSKKYLEQLAIQHGFLIRHIALTDLRNDKKGVIRGYVAVFEKPAAP